MRARAGDPERLARSASRCSISASAGSQCSSQHAVGVVAQRVLAGLRGQLARGRCSESA